MDRAKPRAFGGFLTTMVIPNVGAFIAWGLITALFIPTGWIPNEGFNKLVASMVKCTLPMVLIYSGGRLMHDEHEATARCVGTFGLIIGSKVNMFLGAVIMRPPSAWYVKQFNRLISGRIPAGFEMVVSNFSPGIIAMILSLCSCATIGPIIEFAGEMITSMITSSVKTGFLPLLSIANEPAKVLFLNNVIGQGTYYPLGMQQATGAGKSIFSMVASSPDAGLGLLPTSSFFGKGNSKKIAPGAITIHFLGGIHEIYFPYVLIKSLMIFPMVIGSAYGIMAFEFSGAGLVAGLSPGSIFTYLVLTPRGNFVGILVDVVTATVIGLLLASLILKTNRDNDDEKLEKSIEKFKAMEQEEKDLLASSLRTEAGALKDIAYIALAYDAEPRSSALRATALKKRLQEIGVERTVRGCAIERVLDEADVIVTHISLLDQARLKFPNRRITAIQNFMSGPNLDTLLEEISNTEN